MSSLATIMYCNIDGKLAKGSGSFLGTIRLNKTKKSSRLDFSQKCSFWHFVEEKIEQMLFNNFTCLVHFLLSPFVHLRDVITLFLYILFSEFSELSQLKASLNFYFTERRTSCLTWAILLIASHGNTQSVTVSTKPISTVCINFFVYSSCRNFPFYTVVLIAESVT